MGWQWSAGSGPDATPLFPGLQPRELRPRNSTRTAATGGRWVAELSGRPPETALSFFDAIPVSWAMTPGDGYPSAPVVSASEGRKRALDAYEEQGLLRRTETIGACAAWLHLVQIGRQTRGLHGYQNHHEGEEENLPRYFTAVFDTANRMRHGRLDMVLPDGAPSFATAGHWAGAGGRVAHPQFPPRSCARLIREERPRLLRGLSRRIGGSTPDLQAFMDHCSCRQRRGLRRFPRHGPLLCGPSKKLRFWLQSNSKRTGKEVTSPMSLMTWANDFYRLWLDDTMTLFSALFETGQESLVGRPDPQNMSAWSTLDGRAARRSCPSRSAAAGAVLPNTPAKEAGALRV